jgi:hypothetical protein
VLLVAAVAGVLLGMAGQAVAVAGLVQAVGLVQQVCQRETESVVLHLFHLTLVGLAEQVAPQLLEIVILLG